MNNSDVSLPTLSSWRARSFQKENVRSSAQQHSILQTIALHLVPGIAGTIVYVLIAPVLMDNGYPAILSILIAAAIIILPIELGILFQRARRDRGTYSILDVVDYRQPLSKWNYVVIPLGLVLWAFLASGITQLFDGAIAKAWFAWLPDWFNIFDLRHFEGYSRNALIVTFLVGLVVNGFALPIVEEFYFRGYLLPRIDRFGKWAPLINICLFSLYHFWTPWQVISRIVLLLPWVYTVWHKRNILLIIITHCAANTLGWLLTWGLILRQ